MSEYQEEVLTNLLDLQAELRGDEPESREERTAKPVDADEAEGAGDDETVTVTLAEQGVAVSVVPTGMPVTERLAALNERLARLEQELAGVTKRIAKMEPDAEEKPDRPTSADLDAPWRSFIDLQRIVADRLDQS
jgi:hypothetical protein